MTGTVTLLALLWAGTAPAYREPVVEPPGTLAVDASRPGRHIQINLPAAANAGARRLSYWLTGAEPLLVQVEIARGPSALEKPVRVSAALFLDGRQIPFSVSDRRGRSRRLDLQLTPGVARTFTLAVPGSAIPPGAHTAALLLWDEAGGEFPGVSFAVYRNSTRFSPRRPAKTLAGPPLRAALEVRAAGAVHPLPMFTPASVRPDDEGRLGLEIFLRSRGAKTGAALVAVLDGRQIPFASLGLSPHVVLDGARTQLLKVCFTGLPTRGEHHLTLFAIFGDGQPTEAPLGTRAPWYSAPRALATLRWGQSPGDAASAPAMCGQYLTKR